MKILFICAVFPPEPEPAGVMASQLATNLFLDGHNVTMIVPVPNRPHGVVYPGYKRQIRTCSVAREGYAVVRCANWLIGERRRNIDRLLENITFGLTSMWAMWREGRPDVMIIESWPFFATSACIALACFRRVPYVYYVQDVYPEAAEEAGMLSPVGIISRLLRKWDRRLCEKSAKIITITRAQRDILMKNRGLSEKDFAIVSNWVDEEQFPEWRGQPLWRTSQGISEKTFVAMFAGTLGHVSGAEILVSVAALLRGKEDILILTIGEGIRKQAMQSEVARLGLANIRLLPFQPAERVPEVQASSDLALLTMHERASNSSVPSKLITYFAASRPVICAANTASAVAQAVTEAGAGLVVPPGNAEAIARAIVELKQAPEVLAEMGRNARRYFLDHFTLHQAYKSLHDILHEIHGPDSRGCSRSKLAEQ